MRVSLGRPRARRSPRRTGAPARSASVPLAYDSPAECLRCSKQQPKGPSAHATSGRVHVHTAGHAAGCRTGTAGWPVRSNPATCSKRDGHEMTLPSSGESVGGGEADGQRRARWAACTRGVRASAVMLHGIPAGVHAPGGRARSAGGAVDEPRAATQQHAADRRPPPCPRRLGAVTRLADGTAALNLRRAQP